MLSFAQFLEESFLNLFQSDADKRLPLADDVWNILQASYKSMGGIHGSGFNSKEDMVKNIPFWKLVRRGGTVVTVAMYKDKGGRKLVACGTNGSEEGKAGLLDILNNDLKRERGYVEMSDNLLKFLTRNIGYSLIKKNLKSYAEAEKILSPDELSRPESDDPELVIHPELKDFFYRREIGGKIHTKVMFGKLGNKLVDFGALKSD